MTLKPVLLIVDDNEEILDFLADDLQDDYAIEKAVDGKAALQIVEDTAVHLIVSDVMMPEMDGFELCRMLKSNMHYCHIPVVLLTARNTLQSKIEGLELGADAYIEKPFSPEFLRVQIANLLNNRNKIKEHFASTPLAHIKSIAYSREDEHFLEQLNAAIERKMEDIDFDVNDLSKEMAMSRPTLYRKIKEISNLTPNELINITRLKKAAELLATGQYKIFEVSDQIGFSSQTNFGRSFHKQFGMTPTEYMNGAGGS